MKTFTPFSKLVASEAAVRMESAYRWEHVTLDQKQEHPSAGKERRRVEYSVKNPDAGNTPQQIGKHLYETFLHLYDFAYQDSSQHHTSTHRKDICNSQYLPQADHDRLKQIFDQFAVNAYGMGGQLQLSGDQGPHAMKQLYEQIKKVPLHDTGLASGALLVQIGRGDKWKQNFPNGVDFARSNPRDDLDFRFHNAFFGEEQTPPTKPYIEHTQSYTTIEGVRFPMVKLEFATEPTLREHLVTQTGHIVDLTDELRNQIANHIRAGKALNNIQVPIDDKSYLLNSLSTTSKDFKKLPESAQEILIGVKAKIEHMAKSGIVDGFKLKSKGGKTLTAPLMSMDIDLMTGLNMAKGQNKESDLKQFKDFMSKNGIRKFADLVPESFLSDKVNIQAMSGNKSAQEKARNQLRSHVATKMVELKTLARDNSHLAGIIQQAGTQLQIMLPRAYEHADKAFIDPKTNRVRPSMTDEQPHMYLSMGGSGSGKGGLKKIAKKECDDGKSLVTASLDDVRGETDRYWLYTATNNHNDDYSSVTEFGNTIRDIVSNRAVAGRYNLFIDGSGIPYEHRNDEVVRQFKKERYHVSVLGAQAPLYVGDPGSRTEMSTENMAYDDALLRSGARLAKHLRAIPIPLMVDKHIRFTLASRNAARDPNVDRFLIADVSGEMGSDYTLSYVLPKLDEHSLGNLVKLTGAELKNKLDELGLTPDYVKPPADDKFYNLKVIRDNNIDNPDDHTYRVEVITDVRQYTAMVQKGLYCRETKGPDELYKNTLHADVEEIFKGEGGRLNFTHKEGVARAEYPQPGYIRVVSESHSTPQQGRTRA